jgi:hypothetical protein
MSLKIKPIPTHFRVNRFDSSSPFKEEAIIWDRQLAGTVSSRVSAGRWSIASQDRELVILCRSFICPDVANGSPGWIKWPNDGINHDLDYYIKFQLASAI